MVHTGAAPVDLCKVVLQFNGEDKTLAVRPEDASSLKSNEEYTFFIGAVAIGVRRRCHTAPVPCCLTFLHHDADMLPVPRVQVSITTKKGVNLRKLVPSDFLYSRKCYWVTSSEHPGVWWVDTRPDSATEVKAFRSRGAGTWGTSYPYKQFLTHEDAFDRWVDSWTRKLETSTVGVRGAAGAAFPMSDSEELRQIIDYVHGELHAHTHTRAHTSDAHARTP
jgi:hypothetical protein